MQQPPLEVADLVRAAGQGFLVRSGKWLRGQHVKVLSAIARCRTAALGGHRLKCDDCGHSPPIVYNSCLDRHCPKCQAGTRKRWLEARRKELLPVRYLHVVFTLPRILSQLALQNKKVLYSLLLRTSAQTLLEVARDPRRLGAKIGFFSILHSWNQRLQEHAHIHSVVPAGGLSLDQGRWIDAPSKNFFLPKKVLAEVFRGKFVDGLRKAFAKGELCFYGRFAPLTRERDFKAFVRTLYRNKWVVELRPPFGGPGKALEYLSRYTHRVAISNQRLVSFTQGQVTFRWRDSAHGNQQRLMTLDLYEFLRRFLLHVLPSGFHRIRYYGFLTNSKRGELLPLCRQLIARVNPSARSRFPTPNPLTQAGVVLVAAGACSSSNALPQPSCVLAPRPLSPLHDATSHPTSSCFRASACTVAGAPGLAFSDDSDRFRRLPGSRILRWPFPSAFQIALARPSLCVKALSLSSCLRSHAGSKTHKAQTLVEGFLHIVVSQASSPPHESSLCRVACDTTLRY